MKKRLSSGLRFTQPEAALRQARGGPVPWASRRSKASMAPLMSAISLLRQRS